MQFSLTPPAASRPLPSLPANKPYYRVLSGKFMCNNRLLEPGELVKWPYEPNLQLEPLTKVAREVFFKFTEKLDACGREVAELKKTGYKSLTDYYKKLYTPNGNKPTAVNNKNILGSGYYDPEVEFVDLSNLPVEAEIVDFDFPEQETEATAEPATKSAKSQNTARTVNDPVMRKM